MHIAFFSIEIGIKIQGCVSQSNVAGTLAQKLEQCSLHMTYHTLPLWISSNQFYIFFCSIDCNPWVPGERAYSIFGKGAEKWVKTPLVFSSSHIKQIVEYEGGRCLPQLPGPSDRGRERVRYSDGQRKMQGTVFADKQRYLLVSFT